MTVRQQTPTHKYEVGEEVVVLLKEGQVITVVGAELALAALPEWTIAEVVAVNHRGGDTRYDVSFRWAGSTCACELPESAIEGTA